MKKMKSRLFLFYMAVPVVLLLILLQLGVFYFKSDGFSGLSMFLPVLLAGAAFFAFCTSAFFAAWVYQDCQKRSDDPVLWAAVVFIATPFIGLLLYFLRRSDIKQKCPGCGHPASLQAKYCEECGINLIKEQKSKENTIMKTQKTSHLNLIIAGAVSMVLMLGCLTGFIVNAAAGDNINTNPASDNRVWNLGTISMNYSTWIDGVWKLDFRHASDGFIAQQDMTIENADTAALYADISCSTVPDGASLVLYLVQGNVSQSFDVTNLSEPFSYPLGEFENGKIHVRLQINGVEDTVSEIYIH